MSSVDSGRWPSAGQWLAALGGTVLASVLVTLFGIGFGAVLRSVPLAVVLFLVWFLIVENVLVILFWGQTTLLGGILPNGTANGIVGGIAADAFGFNSLNLPERRQLGGAAAAAAHGAAPGVLSWWASALIFFAWTMLFFGLGWAGNQKPRHHVVPPVRGGRLEVFETAFTAFGEIFCRWRRLMLTT